MLIAAHTSAPLIPRTGSVRMSPGPLAAIGQRPPVLARARQAPQQLSLFGPPGAVRR
jgi:hypothetical protein